MKFRRPLPKTTACQRCGRGFYASPGHLAAGQGRYCSLACRPTAHHGRGNGGTRDDLGFYVRSTWEANYARYLKFLQRAGQIKSWAYEPYTFEFPGIKRGSRFYTPDFCVIENNGDKRWHEIKGYMDAKSRTKLKRMARYFPNETVILIERRQMREINSKVGALIPGWERGRNDKL